MEPNGRRLVRSYLYVPADRADRLAGAAGRGPDAVIADLEDAVAVDRKGEAATNAQAWLAERVDDGVQRWVRVNSGDRGLEDIRTVFGVGLAGVCLPKVSGRDDVVRAGDLLDELERHVGVGAGRTAVMPLVESAVGLQRLADIAAAPRVEKLQLGELDLAADLGLQPAGDETELAPYRAMVVLASAAAGLLPPVGPVSPEYQDLRHLESSTQRLKRAGFVGRVAIHPAQLPTIHATFTVTAEQAAAAQRMLTRYEAALDQGTGVFVGDDGRMVDEAVIRSCRRTLGLAGEARRGEARREETS